MLCHTLFSLSKTDLIISPNINGATLLQKTIHILCTYGILVLTLGVEELLHNPVGVQLHPGSQSSLLFLRAPFLAICLLIVTYVVPSCWLMTFCSTNLLLSLPIQVPGPILIAMHSGLCQAPIDPSTSCKQNKFHC